MRTQNVVRLPDRPEGLGRIVDLDEIEAVLSRARRLAVTPGLSAADLARAHAGRYVLGLEVTP
jgi:hypothetical protein